VNNVMFSEGRIMKTKIIPLTCGLWVRSKIACLRLAHRSTTKKFLEKSRSIRKENCRPFPFCTKGESDGNRHFPAARFAAKLGAAPVSEPRLDDQAAQATSAVEPGEWLNLWTLVAGMDGHAATLPGFVSPPEGKIQAVNCTKTLIAG
jgi:hypothetical protein